MTPVNSSRLSDLYVRSVIKYLDPDTEIRAHSARGKTGRKNRRRKKLIVCLISIAALAGVAGMRYFLLLGKLMN